MQLFPVRSFTQVLLFGELRIMSFEGALQHATQGPASSEGGLPSEILEHVFEEVWNTLEPRPQDGRRINPFDTSMSRYRWGFYVALTATSRQFRALALELPYRFVVLRTAGDVQLYKLLVTRQLAIAQRAGADVDAAHRALFARAHVRLAYALALDDLRELDGPDTVLPRTLGSPLVPAAASVALDRWLVTPALRDWLFGLGALAHLRIGRGVTVPTYASGAPDRSRALFRNDAIPGGGTKEMMFRRIQPLETPLSVGVVEAHGPPDTWAPILAFGMRRAGLQLKRLVLFAPGRLDRASLPPMLATLVLDTPPGEDGTSALAPWGVPAALANGILAAQRRRSTSVRLIVRCAKNVEPLAWESALIACKAHDISLELEKIY
jgi:hypothetical protein